MKKIMLVGKVGCGKTTLTQAINGVPRESRKTQAIEFHDSVVDTPGEYIEKRFFYNALLQHGAACDLIAFVQDCRDTISTFPPGFAVLLKKPVIGIITKIDVSPNHQGFVRESLESLGIKEIYEVSAKEGIGMEALMTFLKGKEDEMLEER